MKNKTAMFSTYLKRFIESPALTSLLLKGIMIAFLFDVGVCSAAAGDTQTQATTTGSAGWDVEVAKLLNLVISVMYAILAPLAMLAGWFLTPDWTFGDIFGLRAPLHNLWILVSNVVYIIFALMLIMIAFMHIFWEWEKDYAIKSSLPRLAVGLIIVPFTWFIVSALSSVANYFTASIIQLPKSILDKGQLETTIKIPKLCTVNFNKKIQSDTAASGTDGAREDRFFDCGPVNDYQTMTLNQFFTEFGKGSYNLVTIYAYSVFKFDKLQSIGNCSGTIQKLSDMSLQMLISIVFFFAYGLLLVSLVVAMGTRAIQLWFFAVISPLFGLFYFFGGKKWGGLKKLEEEYGIGQLIQLALVPVYVAAALVFGFVFIQVVQNASTNANAARTASFFVKVQPCPADDTKDGGVCQQLVFGEGLVLKMKGEPFSMSSAKCSGATGGTNSGDGAGTDPFSLAFGAIGKIIVNLLGLVVMWGALMAALNSSKITQKAIRPIAEFGEKIGSTVADLPKNIPLTIPGTDKKMSMTGLNQVGTYVQNASSSMGTSAVGGFDSDFFSKIVKGDKILNELENIRKNLETAKPVSVEQKTDVVRKTIDTVKQDGGFQKIATDKRYKDKVVSILKGSNLNNDAAIKKLEGATNSKDVASAFFDISEGSLEKNLVPGKRGATRDEIEAYGTAAGVQPTAGNNQNNDQTPPAAPEIKAADLTGKDHEGIIGIIKNKFGLNGTQDLTEAKEAEIKKQLTAHNIPGVDTIIAALKEALKKTTTPPTQ